jgi:hypothetical protein
MEEIRKQLDSATIAMQSTRSALAIYQGCMHNGSLDRAATMREEARMQAMDGVKALLDIANKVSLLPPEINCLDQPAIGNIIEAAESGQ